MFNLFINMWVVFSFLTENLFANKLSHKTCWIRSLQVVCSIFYLFSANNLRMCKYLNINKVNIWLFW